MVNESDVKVAFLRVKQDIASIGKVLNNLRAQVAGLSRESAGFAGRREFYDFIDALELRLKKLDSQFISVKDYGKIASSYDKKLDRQSQLNVRTIESLNSAVEKVSSRQDDLDEQLKSLKKSVEKAASVEGRIDDISARMDEEGNVSAGLARLQSQLSEFKGKVSSMELRILEIPDFRSLAKRMEELELKFLETKKLVKETDISELKAELSELARDFSRLDRRFIDRPEFSKYGKNLERELELLNDGISSFSSDIESLRRTFVANDDFKELSERLNGKLGKLSESVDSIYKSEIDISEYLTLDDYKKSFQELKRDIENVKANLVTAKDVERAISGIYSEIRELKPDEVRIEKGSASQKRDDSLIGEGHDRGYDEKSSIASYIVALVIIVLLVAAGYYVYTQMVPVQSGNQTSNITGQPSMLVPSPGQQNITPATSNESKINKPVNLSEECILRFECLTDSQGRYNVGCFFDSNSSVCMCFKENQSCSPDKAAALNASRNAGKNLTSQFGSGSPFQGVGGDYRIYLAALAAVMIFVVLLAYLFKKGGENHEEGGEAGDMQEKDEHSEDREEPQEEAISRNEKRGRKGSKY